MTRRLWESVDDFLGDASWFSKGNAGDLFTQELLNQVSLIDQPIYFKTPLEKRIGKLHPYSDRNSAWIKNQEWIIRAIRFSDQWGGKVEYLLEHDGAGWVTEEGPQGTLQLEERWYSSLDGTWLTDEQAKQITIEEGLDWQNRTVTYGVIEIDGKIHRCYKNKKLKSYLMAWGKELLFPEYVSQWKNPVGRFHARTEEDIKLLTKPVPSYGEQLLPYALEAARKLGWSEDKIEEVISMAEVTINEYKSADTEVVSIESGRARLNLTVEEARELLTKIPAALKEYETTRYNALADQVKLLTEEMLKIKPKAKVK